MEIHRQRLVDEVDARLKTILTANGYMTDIGSNVHHWYTATKDVESLEYRDPRRVPADKEVYGADFFTLTFDIEVNLYSSNATPEYARKVFADIETMIGKDDEWIIQVGEEDVALATDTSYLGDEMEVQHEEKKVFAPVCSFSITYYNPTFNPFISGT